MRIQATKENHKVPISFLVVQPKDITATKNNMGLMVEFLDSNLDRVFQNIRTEGGARYFVSFDLRDANVSNDDAANVRVRWNGEFTDSFFGTEQWQRFGVVVDTESGFSTLMFREAGNSTNSDAQIDNIKIYKIDSLTSDFSLDLNGDQQGVNNERTYTENSTQRVNSGSLSLQFSNGNFLSSATARVLGFTGSESLLADTSGTNITPNFDADTGILRLVGRDRVSNYQRVLRSIQFVDTNDDPGEVTRQVVVSATDGTASSDRPRALLNVAPVNLSLIHI